MKPAVVRILTTGNQFQFFYFTCPVLVSVSGRELGPVSDQSPRRRSFFIGAGLELRALPYRDQITDVILKLRNWVKIVRIRLIRKAESDPKKTESRIYLIKKR